MAKHKKDIFLKSYTLEIEIKATSQEEADKDYPGILEDLLEGCGDWNDDWKTSNGNSFKVTIT